jgi:hypothetical protein
MSTRFSYSTSAHHVESGLNLQIATVHLGSISDPRLASALREGALGTAAEMMSALSGPDGQMNVIPVANRGDDAWAERWVERITAVVLTDSSSYAAEAAWRESQFSKPSESWTAAVSELLETAEVLIEQSDPHAAAAAAAIGAAAATGSAGVLVAGVSAGLFTGGVVLIATPLSIIAVGAGAGWLVYRLIAGRQK